MLQWLWIIKMSRKKKCFTWKIISCSNWSNYNFEKQIYFHHLFFHMYGQNAFYMYKICITMEMYLHFIDQVPLFNIMYIIFLYPFKKLHKMHMQWIYYIKWEIGFMYYENDFSNLLIFFVDIRITLISYMNCHRSI